MLYTVNEMAKLAGVTVKTLHHYHKSGLLLPCRITEAGYRLYGIKELERLQQILFYRELDFSLAAIKRALEDEPNRLECLISQRKLLTARKERLGCLLKTITDSIANTKKGAIMNEVTMFQGLNKEEWKKALAEQNEYLKKHYAYDLLETGDIHEQRLNEAAAEAKQFIGFMSQALQNGWKTSDQRLKNAVREHLEFLCIDATAFVSQAKFFLEDDFHRNILESQQIGLSYYLYVAAEEYVAS